MAEQVEYSKRVRMRDDAPDRLKVYFLNDDVTTMEFVVEILVTVFFYEVREATQVMLRVHNEGEALVGTYAADIARSKVSLVERKARAAGFPLKCRLEGA